MILAVASGKGGTGKTTVAVGLALSARGGASLLDCDVEEPNCHIFVKPEILRREPVMVPIPKVDKDACNSCGQCSEFCRFHAIVALKTEPLVFPELCHGCGGCAWICPRGAIREIRREIGAVEVGMNGGLRFIQGIMNVGQAMSPPVIRAVKAAALEGNSEHDRVMIVDCPPGTACPMVAAVRGSDAVVLVTEPTPFGLHDLRLAAETVRKLGIPFGVAINRSDCGDGRVEDYCGAEKIPILLRIPERRDMAEGYSRGESILSAAPEYREPLLRLLEETSRMAVENKKP
ncbi:MAG TPA: ATP-binding protein [Candidatus Brocadiia bacterium]|nr:ATP-binding protein [Candidatus Brocadiia bacterium]